MGPPNALPRLDIINCLLKQGADPNYPLHGIKGVNQLSIWLQTLHHILEKYDGKELKLPWSEIAETMIRHGARVDMDMIYLFKDQKKMGECRDMRPFSYGWGEVSLFNHLYMVKQPVSRSWFPWISGPSRYRPPSLPHANSVKKKPLPTFEQSNLSGPPEMASDTNIQELPSRGNNGTGNEDYNHHHHITTYNDVRN